MRYIGIVKRRDSRPTNERCLCHCSPWLLVLSSSATARSVTAGWCASFYRSMAGAFALTQSRRRKGPRHSSLLRSRPTSLAATTSIGCPFLYPDTSAVFHHIPARSPPDVYLSGVGQNILAEYRMMLQEAAPTRYKLSFKKPEDQKDKARLCAMHRATPTSSHQSEAGGSSRLRSKSAADHPFRTHGQQLRRDHAHGGRCTEGHE